MTAQTLEDYVLEQASAAKAEPTTVEDYVLIRQWTETLSDLASVMNGGAIPDWVEEPYGGWEEREQAIADIEGQLEFEELQLEKSGFDREAIWNLRFHTLDTLNQPHQE